ncbi:MAG: molybdopterin converting factor subunit 1 [Thioalkalispiraceae bacterium]|jgi:molybdopterin synthase sulfur carrier subunit
MSKPAIQVRFFASLREQVGVGEVELAPESVKTVADAWQQSTHQAAMPANTLMAVNMEYVAADHPVSEGDEVAFFPPVTGG